MLLRIILVPGSRVQIFFIEDKSLKLEIFWDHHGEDITACRERPLSALLSRGSSGSHALLLPTQLPEYFPLPVI